MTDKKLIADFVVRTPAERDDELVKALAIAKNEAGAGGRAGILVTRHHFRRFSVSLSTAVPYGLIHERDHAQR